MTLLPLLLGCAGEAADSSAPSDHAELACEQVWIPAGLSDEDPIPAQAHEAIYGRYPEPWHVRLGWPTSDPSRSASFLWRTDDHTLASQVRIGPASGFPDNATTWDGASFRFGSLIPGEGDHRIHEVRLCQRLQPNTVYSYQVGGQDSWSETYTFATPGERGSFDTFRVGIAGDSRGGYGTWARVLSAMEAHEPDFLVFSGDMVDIGVNQSEWDAWFEAGDPILAERVLVPAHGNHEFLAQNYFAQFSLPGNEEWFGLTYGDLALVSLNDTVRDLDHISTDQVQFLDEFFSEHAGLRKMVTHHKALYSTCSTHHSNEPVREVWGPVLDEHDVELVSAGHNHIYERSLPIRYGEAVAPEDGTTFLVTGGAGAPLYTGVDPEWFGAVARPIEHYVIADFGPDGIDLVARDLDGNVIDSFSIPR